jgi:hypothetical protein
MPKRILISLILVTVVIGPATAQNAQRGGLRTETMERLANQQSGFDLLWNLMGAAGLLGLLGFRQEHPDDSYHPAAME